MLGKCLDAINVRELLNCGCTNAHFHVGNVETDDGE